MSCWSYIVVAAPLSESAASRNSRGLYAIRGRMLSFWRMPKDVRRRHPSARAPKPVRQIGDGSVCFLPPLGRNGPCLAPSERAAVAALGNFIAQYRPSSGLTDTMQRTGLRESDQSLRKETCVHATGARILSGSEAERCSSTRCTRENGQKLSRRKRSLAGTGMKMTR